MTQAVCFACGEIKLGAFNACGACRQRPVSDDSLMLSLAIMDHFFDGTALKRIGQDVKLGNIPSLDDETKTRLLPQVQRAKAMLGRVIDKSAEAGPHLAATRTHPLWRFWRNR
jgi:hypothetical protein